ncbi:MAG TPA: hypothetical protein VFY26_10555 [Anaerolineales bacterium]|nr:hypothetical protein [Anaerolineales bacterium]
MQNWEYMVLQLVMNEKENLVWLDAPEDSRSIADRLNALGTQGWELVSVDTNSLSGVTIRTIYYLKRPGE